MAQDSNFSIGPGWNCNHKNMCPYWCCCPAQKYNNPKYVSCEKLQSDNLKFVGNERWLDYHEELKSHFCPSIFSFTVFFSKASYSLYGLKKASNKMV